MSNFIDSMININNSVPVTPSTALMHIDDSPYCWVILAYHSELDHHLYEGFFLIFSLSGKFLNSNSQIYIGRKKIIFTQKKIFWPKTSLSEKRFGRTLARSPFFTTVRISVFTP